jgi:alpha-L-rhamnosidase
VFTNAIAKRDVRMKNVWFDAAVAVRPNSTPDQLERIAARVLVGDMRCENRPEPLGIDATQPRLSWILNASERGQRQTAYQVLVASSAASLDASKGDLWDSGKVISDQSTQVRYAGKPLASHAQCFWKVRVWDKDGNVSA